MPLRQNKGFMEEQILLGGKISNKHQEYKKIAQNTPQNQKAVWFLENWEALLKLNPIDTVCQILTEFGKIDNFSGFGEITKLSAILGDSRTYHSGKKIKDVLRQKLNSR